MAFQICRVGNVRGLIVVSGIVHVHTSVQCSFEPFWPGLSMSHTISLEALMDPFP